MVKPQGKRILYGIHCAGDVLHAVQNDPKSTALCRSASLKHAPLRFDLASIALIAAPFVLGFAIHSLLCACRRICYASTHILCARGSFALHTRCALVALHPRAYIYLRLPALATRSRDVQQFTAILLHQYFNTLTVKDSQHGSKAKER
jgi:hypothetical protein